MRRFVLLTFVLAALLSAASPDAVAATSSRPPVAHAPGDPLETFNRANFNSTRDIVKVVRPILALYRALTPGIIGRSIHNVLVNLKEPVVIVNDLLQLRVARAGEACSRLAFNTTLGLLGLIDVSAAAGNPHHDNGFGNTLGHYGVGPVPYLFLPLVGPSTVRDLFGTAADMATSPIHYINFPSDVTVNIGVAVFGGLDAFSGTEGQLDVLLADAADPYATLRSAYLQNREAQIHGANAPTVLPDLGEPEALPPTPAPSPGSAPPPSAPPTSAPPDAGPAPASGGSSDGTGPGPQASLDEPIATAIS
jgi:phospholipid-binding lipoprotein MlaA